MSHTLERHGANPVLYLTRDSNCLGEFAPHVEVWTKRPLRTRLLNSDGYVWVPTDGDNATPIDTLDVRACAIKYGATPEGSTMLAIHFDGTLVDLTALLETKIDHVVHL